jgi:DNA-binding response OmpR family regulator
MNQPLQVLLVGGSEADASRIAEVLRAGGHVCEVKRCAASGAALELATLRPLLCVVIALDEGIGSGATWRRLLDELQVDAPLFVLGELTQEPTITRWLTEGANDWVFRPHLAGLNAVLARLERERAEALARETMERRWRDSTSELVRLARHPSFQSADVTRAVEEVNEAAVNGLQITRCGVWLFEAGEMRQVDTFDARTSSHAVGAKLPISPDFRRYFDSLQAQRLLSIADVRRDPLTLPLVDGYFGPEGVTATIDVALRLRGELVGALCLEHLDRKSVV